VKATILRHKKWLPLPLFLLILFLGYSALSGEEKDKNTATITSLEKEIREEKIKSIDLDPATETVSVTRKNDTEYTIGLTEKNAGFIINLAKKNNVIISSKPIETRTGLLQSVFRFLPTLLIVALIIAIVGMQFGWFNRVGIEAAQANVSFSDVAGCREAVGELEDVRHFLESPTQFEKLGAKVPKGVLLYGPPGTGKTLLAKAVANEAGVPFYASSGSEFIEMFAGLGARRVRQLFEKAKKTAPSIIFIDELDAVGGHRSSGGGGDGASREADQTLIQLLKEMDGFSVSEHPVIVIGATNRIEALDRALTRPGRFDRHIAIDPPDKNGRLEVLNVHAGDKKLAASVDLDNLATQTSGMTGADLALILNEAALFAAKRGASSIEDQDIDDAYFRVVAGAKKDHQVLSEKEREIIAYHECGHALVGERLRSAEKVHKISIIPRGRSGGQTLYVSEEDIFLYSTEQLRDTICSLLAGRAAEELVFGEITSGAADDLNKVSDIAHRMVYELGMSKKIGLRVLRQGHSPALSEKAEEEIFSIIEEEYERAKKILAEEKDILEDLAQVLQEKETIDRDFFLQVINKK
jgi:cell division protease FtsH